MHHQRVRTGVSVPSTRREASDLLKGCRNIPLSKYVYIGLTLIIKFVGIFTL